MSPPRRERGIAMLVVLITVTLVTAVVVEFQYSSRVDLQLAFNARDELQAEYNALTALRLRAVLLRQSRALETGLNALLGSLTGDANAKLPISQILEQVPIECGLLSAVLRKSETELGRDGEDFFDGDCTASSRSEHSKISINMLARAGNNASTQIANLLLGFLGGPAMLRHFEEDDRNGTHAENPAELVAALTDWVDRDRNQTGSTSDEDRHYAYLKDSYRAKNAPFDSLAELQLVHGVDDELYRVLKENVTIYSDSTAIELATATPERVLFGLLAARRSDVTAPQLIVGIAALLRALADLRASSTVPGFGTLTVASLTSAVQANGLDGLIDTQRLREIFTDRGGTTWYTLEAQGRVGNATRTMHAVFQATEGQFYYFRVE